MTIIIIMLSVILGISFKQAWFILHIAFSPSLFSLPISLKIHLRSPFRIFLNYLSQLKQKNFFFLFASSCVTDLTTSN